MTVNDYINALGDRRKEAVSKLREVVLSNIPKGFEEIINYGMIGYVVPLSIYKEGYKDPNIPLPFINIASQKNYISFYHLGIYGRKDIYDWFLLEYQKLNIGKLDIGKSCIRFKDIDKIPFNLMGELASKMTVSDMVELYNSSRRS